MEFSLSQLLVEYALVNFTFPLAFEQLLEDAVSKVQ